MRNWKLVLLAILLAFAACKKDTNNNGNNNNNNNNNNNTSSSYNTISGSWYWMAPQYLHLGSNYATVQGAWSVNGTIYAYIIENIGLQYISKLKYYNATDTTWNDLYTDVNADGQTSITEHQGKLYLSANAYDKGTVYEIDGTNATQVYSITWNNNLVQYFSLLGSTGTDLYQVRILDGTPDTVFVERFNSGNWQADTSFTFSNVKLSDMRVMNGNNEIWIALNDAAADNSYIYTYDAATGLNLYTVFPRNNIYTKPSFMVHNGQLYGLLALGTGSNYTALASIQPDASYTIVAQPPENEYLWEAQSTTAGIVYTQGGLLGGTTNTLGNILMLGSGSKPDLYEVASDTTSPQYTTVVGTVGRIGIYLGAYYFMQNGMLYAIGNGHVGVFSTTGSPAAKTYMMRYKEQ